MMLHFNILYSTHYTVHSAHPCIITRVHYNVYTLYVIIAHF